MLADDLGAIGANLFRQLAEHGGTRVLVGIDAALGQLPATGWTFRVRHIGAPRNEYLAEPIE
jgi:hypothetical protein